MITKIPSVAMRRNHLIQDMLLLLLILLLFPAGNYHGRSQNTSSGQESLLHKFSAMHVFWFLELNLLTLFLPSPFYE